MTFSLLWNRYYCPWHHKDLLFDISLSLPKNCVSDKVVIMLNQTSHHEGMWVHGGITPCFLNFGTKWTRLASFVPQVLWPYGNNLFLNFKNLGNVSLICLCIILNYCCCIYQPKLSMLILLHFPLEKMYIDMTGVLTWQLCLHDVQEQRTFLKWWYFWYIWEASDFNSGQNYGCLA